MRLWRGYEPGAQDDGRHTGAPARPAHGDNTPTPQLPSVGSQGRSPGSKPRPCKGQAGRHRPAEVRVSRLRLSGKTEWEEGDGLQPTPWPEPESQHRFRRQKCTTTPQQASVWVSCQAKLQMIKMATGAHMVISARLQRRTAEGQAGLGTSVPLPPILRFFQDGQGDADGGAFPWSRHIPVPGRWSRSPTLTCTASSWAEAWRPNKHKLTVLGSSQLQGRTAGSRGLCNAACRQPHHPASPSCSGSQERAMAGPAKPPRPA